MILFLDIDGVLATDKQFVMLPDAKSYIQKYHCYPFDNRCVKVFNKLFKNYDIKIVLSSDWRLHFNLEELQDIFRINGMCHVPQDTTQKEDISFDLKRSRALQIKKYIEKHNIGNDFIVLDDIDFGNFFEDHFIHCKYTGEGIKQSGLREKISEKVEKYFIV